MGRKKSLPTLKIPEKLVRHVKEGKCVLFVGSGLSANANLPTWEKLIKAMLKRLHDKDLDARHIRELNALFRDKKYAEIAYHCKKILNIDEIYSEILRPKLSCDDITIPEHHKIIINMPFAGIVTTNYDKLLELAYIREGKEGWPRTPTQLSIDMLGSLLFEGKSYILKAHGDIEDKHSLVLTIDDYNRIIHNNQAFNSFFSALLLTKAILFIGYSVSDPDFRLLLDRQFTIFNGQTPERYALMSKVGEIERDVLLKTAGIQVLSYKEHSEVLEFLKTLQSDLAL